MNEEQPQTPQEPAAQEYKPNIYPIMYWALLFGLAAGLILFLVLILARFITLVWVPVFLLGAAWGAYRNYRKQKDEWMNAQGVAPIKKSAMEEFKDAARDIVSASREMIAEQRAEDQQAAAEQQAVEEEATYAETPVQEPDVPQEPYTPEPPAAPQQPPADPNDQPRLPNQ
ncbi:MAG: hypothetical protein WEC84_02160 [Candidatus Andersenbacteria bacterium]